MIRRKMIAVGVSALFPLLTVTAVTVAVAVEAAASGIRHQLHR